MNRFLFLILNIVFLNLIYILDRAFLGIFGFADYFALTIFYLLLVLNFLPFNYKILDLFYFGMLLNWSYKTFFGVLPLVLIIIAFLYDFIKEKFAGNIISNALLNLAISFLMFAAYHNFNFIFDLKIILGSFIAAVLISLVNFLPIRK